MPARGAHRFHTPSKPGCGLAFLLAREAKYIQTSTGNMARVSSVGHWARKPSMTRTNPTLRLKDYRLRRIQGLHGTLVIRVPRLVRIGAG